MQDRTETSSDTLKQMALECAAMPMQVGMCVANGNAVLAILSYARTLRGISENERDAVAAKAFDIFAAAVQASETSAVVHMMSAPQE